MIPLDETARQLTGAWKMAFDSPDWRAALARDTDSVFGSFWALAFSAPLVILTSILGYRAAMRMPGVNPAAIPPAPELAAAAFDLAAAAATWAASLALLLAIARRTGLSSRAADIVVGWNWIQPMTLLAAIPTAAVAAATGNATVAGALAAPAVIVSIALYYGFVRRAFAPSVGAAIGIVILLVLTEALTELSALALMNAIYRGA